MIYEPLDAIPIGFMIKSPHKSDPRRIGQGPRPVTERLVETIGYDMNRSGET